jgi:putative Mg2+ transporter-C (MgtC) family protein
MTAEAVHAVIDWGEIVLRLGIATLAGAAIGLNRDLHGKPIGLRTLAIVSLASAMVVTIADLSDNVPKLSDATSRVIQGILTGIGFLGAGVIMRRQTHARVRGLTSAACTFLTACVGIVCGVGQWRVIGIGLALAFIVLIIGGPLERALHRLLGGRDPSQEKSKPSEPISPPPP